jgi:hypothetical protein
MTAPRISARSLAAALVLVAAVAVAKRPPAPCTLDAATVAALAGACAGACPTPVCPAPSVVCPAPVCPAPVCPAAVCPASTCTCAPPDVACSCGGSPDAPAPTVACTRCRTRGGRTRCQQCEWTG